MELVKKPETAQEVIPHDVTPLQVNTDAGAYARVGWMIVLFGVLGFLIWASFAPLDKGVPMSGTVTKEMNRQAVQHLQGGIVQDILVKDGDHVKAGQVVVKLNSIQAKSAKDTVEAQYLTARAAEARLSAELTGQSSVKAPASLAKYKDDPRLAEIMNVQNALFTSRRGAVQSELASIDENIAGLETQVRGLRDSMRGQREQQVILKEQLENSRALAQDGYVARNRMLDVERTYAQIQSAIAENNGNIGHIESQITEMKLRRAQRSNEYQKEVRGQLSDTQREADALEGKLQGLDFDVSSTEVKAPVDGVVTGSNVFTRGGTVGPGVKMMEIVPSNDELVVEGQLPVNLIDRVHPGLKVELIFSAFNVNRTPHIPGEVIQVAADRTVDERTGTPSYKVRARVTAEGAKMIAAKKLDIVPGMPVELFVKTGERTMMSYLLKPVFDRAKSAMTEE